MLKKFKLSRDLIVAIRMFRDTQGALCSNFNDFNFGLFAKTLHSAIYARKGTRFLKFLKEINNEWEV